MNVTLSIFSTIFFFPSATSDFTFSRSALLSSPSTIRPSSAATVTPSTSRVVIFNATLVSSSLGIRVRRQPGPEPRSISVFGAFAKRSFDTSATATRSIVIRAGHVIPAGVAEQLASSRLQPLRTHRAIPRGVLLFQRCCRFRGSLGPVRPSNRLSPYFPGGHLLLSGLSHGPPVIAQPPIHAKAQHPLSPASPSRRPSWPVAGAQARRTRLFRAESPACTDHAQAGIPLRVSRDLDFP